MLTTRQLARMHKVPPTVRQVEALSLAQQFIEHHGFAPSNAELASVLGITPVAAHLLCVRLQMRGLVKRVPNTARSLVLTSYGNEILRRSA